MYTLNMNFTQQIFPEYNHEKVDIFNILGKILCIFHAKQEDTQTMG